MSVGAVLPRGRGRAGGGRRQPRGVLRRGGEPPRLARRPPCRSSAGARPGRRRHVARRQRTRRPGGRHQPPPSRPPPERPRSRGLLVRDLLALPGSRGGGRTPRPRELGGDRYAGCNVVCATPRDAVLVHGGDWLRVRPLPPGLHVLDQRRRQRRRATAASPTPSGGSGGRRTAPPTTAWRRCAELCVRHEPGEPPICFRLADRGTVSSTHRRPAAAARRTSVYLHAQGPPDRTPYEDYSRPASRDGRGAAQAHEHCHAARPVRRGRVLTGHLAELRRDPLGLYCAPPANTATSRCSASASRASTSSATPT